MRVLGIETSCDETAVAVMDSTQGLIGHRIYSQIPIHTLYGGVVPELASRDHCRKLLPLVQELLEQIKCTVTELDAIAYTAGPGLAGALLVGSTFAQSLAWSLQIPTLAINHLEGHILAVMLEQEHPSFPFLALLVSGGHTQLVAARELGRYEVLGQTLDDACGEAFDKTAKLLGLGYPGGKALAELAKQGRPGHFQFGLPMMNRPGCDFSFSGLKTKVRQTWENSNQCEQTKADIAYAFQETVVETLIAKSERALSQCGYHDLAVVGGVGANERLREHMQMTMNSKNVSVYYPRPSFCTDNAAMIAYVGLQRALHGEQHGLTNYVRSRWPLFELQSPVLEN